MPQFFIDFLCSKFILPAKIAMLSFSSMTTEYFFIMPIRSSVFFPFFMHHSLISPKDMMLVKQSTASVIFFSTILPLSLPINSSIHAKESRIMVVSFQYGLFQMALHLCLCQNTLKLFSGLFSGC